MEQTRKEGMCRVCRVTGGHCPAAGQEAHPGQSSHTPRELLLWLCSPGPGRVCWPPAFTGGMTALLALLLGVSVQPALQHHFAATDLFRKTPAGTPTLHPAASARRSCPCDCRQPREQGNSRPALQWTRRHLGCAFAGSLGGMRRQGGKRPRQDLREARGRVGASAGDSARCQQAGHARHLHRVPRGSHASSCTSSRSEG